MSLPTDVELNAWDGHEAAHGGLRDDAENWGADRSGLPHPQAPLPITRPVDLTHWWDRNVGYGILLPEPDAAARSDAEKAARATGADAPEPIQDLIAARPGTVVLRWSPDLPGRHIRRYFPDGRVQDPVIGLSPFGVGENRLPKYVLIVGGPDVIPWSVQYALNTRHAVGRLPMSDDGLGNYVQAMLSGWKDAPADMNRALTWTVDHGGLDITREMRAVVANPLSIELAPPPLAQLCNLTDGNATGEALLKALAEVCPGLVVTSSHGLTAPLDDADRMRTTLGLPVDCDHQAIELPKLDAAMPGGTIWYAYACCTAGADRPSHFTSLLRPGSTAHSVTSAVAALGPMVAPAAQRILGRTNPARAVLGHVEPTFDWTLRVEETGQMLGHDIVAALSSHLYAGEPLGLALTDYRAGVGELHTQWADCHGRLADGDTSVVGTMVRLRLTSLDRQSLVLLGDPTVALPALV